MKLAEAQRQAARIVTDEDITREYGGEHLVREIRLLGLKSSLEGTPATQASFVSAAAPTPAALDTDYRRRCEDGGTQYAQQIALGGILSI
jgi:hypothetical protein